MRYAVVILLCVLVGFIVCCGGGGEQKGRTTDDDDDDDDTSLNVPKAPSDLETLAEQYAVWLFWRDNSDNEQGFRLYFKDAEKEYDPYLVLTDLGVDVVQYYYFTGPEQNLEYYVVAFNEYGESSCSNTAIAKTRPNEPVITHIDCECGLTKGCKIIVGWNDSHVEDGYKLKVNGKEHCDCVEGCKPCTCTGGTYFGCYVSAGMFSPGSYTVEVIVYNDLGEFSSSSPVACLPKSSFDTFNTSHSP